MTLRRLTLVVAPLVLSTRLLLSCGGDEARQGDRYAPDGTLPIAAASDRPEGGSTRCDACTSEGGSCDAGAAVLPVGDASAEPTNTCETARVLGTVSGDTGATSVTGKGTCSEWLSLRATEDNGSALGAPMKVKLTLTPVAADFDMFVFYDPVRDVRACERPFASSYVPGAAAEVVSITWGEGSVANGSDDVRTIGVAVIKSGPCSGDGGAASWTLLAEGNR